MVHWTGWMWWLPLKLFSTRGGLFTWLAQYCQGSVPPHSGTSAAGWGDGALRNCSPGTWTNTDIKHRHQGSLGSNAWNNTIYFHKTNFGLLSITDTNSLSHSEYLVRNPVWSTYQHDLDVQGVNCLLYNVCSVQVFHVYCTRCAACIIDF